MADLGHDNVIEVLLQMYITYLKKYRGKILGLPLQSMKDTNEES